MDRKIGVDVSSCLLFEDTADSETDSVPHKVYTDNSIAGDDDDQDAESCSCDINTSDVLGLSEVVDCDDQDSGVYSNGSDDRRHEPATGLSSCKMWLSDAALGRLPREEGEEESSRIIGEINKDEMEDRLFWETCMAVGYP